MNQWLCKKSVLSLLKFGKEENLIPFCRTCLWKAQSRPEHTKLRLGEPWKFLLSAREKKSRVGSGQFGDSENQSIWYVNTLKMFSNVIFHVTLPLHLSFQWIAKAPVSSSPPWNLRWILCAEAPLSQVSHWSNQFKESSTTTFQTSLIHDTATAKSTVSVEGNRRSKR